MLRLWCMLRCMVRLWCMLGYEVVVHARIRARWRPCNKGMGAWHASKGMGAQEAECFFEVVAHARA